MTMTKRMILIPSIRIIQIQLLGQTWLHPINPTHTINTMAEGLATIEISEKIESFQEKCIKVRLISTDKMMGKTIREKETAPIKNINHNQKIKIPPVHLSEILKINNINPVDKEFTTEMILAKCEIFKNLLISIVNIFKNSHFSIRKFLNRNNFRFFSFSLIILLFLFKSFFV